MSQRIVTISTAVVLALPGPDLPLTGPLFRKKCGAPNIYISPNCLQPTRTVVIVDILLRTRAAMHTTIAAWNNFLCFCGGPLLVGAPVRPNMLNMPKSASEHYVVFACKFCNDCIVLHVYFHSVLSEVVCLSVCLLFCFFLSVCLSGPSCLI